MNDKLICPFCQQELQQTYDGKQFWCSNYKDPTHPINLLGTKELWQALIDTKKKLDIAVDALKVLDDDYFPQEINNPARITLEQINQKEEK